MQENLNQNKTTKANTLIDDAKDAANTGHDTENQLSNNLISVTLAFVALIATAISVSNVLPNITLSQKILIITSMIAFTISIIIGLTNYYLNMISHQQSAQKSRQKAQAVKSANSTNEVKSISRTESNKRIKATNRNNSMILAQMFLLVAGLILCVTFIGTLLFITSNTKI